MDFKPLDPAAFPLNGIRLIEASAGTGKTYAIANLFLRLVAEQGLAVERILVVTFTRAATEELRGRVRERIREALGQWDQAGIKDGFLRTLKERCADPGRDRLKAALLVMDEAAIFTIHGFCQRVLTDNAFESRAGFETEFVNDDQEYRLQVIRDFWRSHCYPLPKEAAAWVAARWGTPEGLLGALKDDLSRPGLRVIPETSPDLDGVIKTLTPVKQQAAALWLEERDTLIADLIASKALSHSAKTYKKDNLNKVAAGMDRYFADTEALLSLPLNLDLFTTRGIEGNITKTARKKGLEPPRHALFDLCETLHRQAGDLGKEFILHLRAQAREACSLELMQRKQAANVMSPDDLLTYTHAALQGEGGPALAERIRQRYPVALIDEFQDTDPIQYGIFHRVYGVPEEVAEEQALVMIGDPKQAIYSFRGADLFTYLQAAASAGPDGGQFSLDTNWRSATALVEAVNVLFGTGRPFVLDGTMGYQRVAAADRADAKPLLIEGDNPAAIHLWHVPAQPELLHQGSIPGTRYQPLIAAGCAAEIVRLLELGLKGQARVGQEPLQAKDIAVLVRNRHEAGHIRQALAERGVGSAFISRDSVFDSAMAPWLPALLETVLLEGREAPLRKALAGPILGWNAGQLSQLNQDELALEAVQLRFQAYARLWRSQGFMAMFSRLLHGEGVPARLWELPGGERDLTDLRHLGELLQAASREVHGGPEGLLRWLRDELASGRGGGEDAQQRLESDENLVQLVTVHKSKGLQYPLVFLPFPWTARPYTDKSDSLLFHDGEGVLTLDLGSENYPDHLLPAERERLAEDMRLLYVALTRAQHRVYCTWGLFKNAQASAFAHLLHGASQDLAQVLPGKALNLDDEQIAARLEELAAAHPECFARVELPHASLAPLSQPERPDRTAGLRRFERQLSATWRVTSYSALAAGREDLPERPDFDSPAQLPEAAPQTEMETETETSPETEPSGVFAFPRGIRAGHCLHGILEELDFRQADGPEYRRLILRHLQRQALDPAHEELVAQWLQRVLNTPLNAEGSLRLNLLEPAERVAEMGFYLPLSSLHAPRLEELLERWRGDQRPVLAFGQVQGMLNGFIDLIFSHQGRYYVADYKSNHLGNSPGDYSPQCLEPVVRDHLYDLQYLIYCVALHRYLQRRQPDYEYERHFGGVYYLFLRGMDGEGEANGVYYTQPDQEFIQDLDRLFHGKAR